jgi:hypothetical protein
MKKSVWLSVLVVLVLASVAPAQDTTRMQKRFTNQDVIGMVTLGLSEDVVIAKIRAASAAGADATSFDTSVDGLKALKAANVPDAVIKVMINPAQPPPPIVAAATAMTIDPNLPPPEVGVYWKDGSNFVLLPGQALSQSKVGGKAGSMFTYGMRGLHWDAYLDGPTANTRIKDIRPSFYVYVPDGSSAADFVLLKLNKKGNRREFQIGTFGGMTGGKSGVKHDKEVAFKAEHVGIRTYKLSLGEELKAGEYGFFMGTGQEASVNGDRGGRGSGGAATGRVYDFSVPE